MRTRRWARIAFSAETKPYTPTFMCTKRPMTSNTLLACTVVKTRWPVRADCTAMLAVWVADLADHDLVRVVAQDGAQPAREGEALLLVHRDLQHAGELVLDRVLDGDDLVLPAVDLADRGVQRSGLAAAGGAGD